MSMNSNLLHISCIKIGFCFYKISKTNIPNVGFTNINTFKKATMIRFRKRKKKHIFICQKCFTLSRNVDFCGKYLRMNK